MTPVVLALLDQMEDLIASAPALGDRIIVARTPLLEYIDAMRTEVLQLADERPKVADGRGR
jgi:hypothetical protein